MDALGLQPMLKVRTASLLMFIMSCIHWTLSQEGVYHHHMLLEYLTLAIKRSWITGVKQVKSAIDAGYLIEELKTLVKKGSDLTSLTPCLTRNTPNPMDQKSISKFLLLTFHQFLISFIISDNQVSRVYICNCIRLFNNCWNWDEELSLLLFLSFISTLTSTFKSNVILLFSAATSTPVKTSAPTTIFSFLPNLHSATIYIPFNIFCFWKI